MSSEPTTTTRTPAILTGQVAIVTGGGRGIGRAVARAVAQAGATVIPAARTRTEVKETAVLVAQDGGRAPPKTLAVADRASVEGMVQEVLAEFGQIDVLVINAGSCAALGPVWETDPDLWLRDLTTNLFGTFLCSRAVLPHMIGRHCGTIINTTGGGAAVPGPFYTGYASSKAGILRFTDSLAAEVAPHNIYVFAMSPGLVLTAMTKYLMGLPNAQAYIPSYVAALTEGRHRPPEAAGELAVFLATVRDQRLSGRFFRVGSDYATAVERADDIAREDLQTLRLRT